MATRKSSQSLTLKLSGPDLARLENLSTNLGGGIPPRILVAAGLHALDELSGRDLVRVILACVEGDPVAWRSPQRKPKAKARRNTRR
jgi:hypothetical protein